MHIAWAAIALVHAKQGDKGRQRILGERVFDTTSLNCHSGGGNPLTAGQSFVLVEPADAGVLAYRSVLFFSNAAHRVFLCGGFWHP